MHVCASPLRLHAEVHHHVMGRMGDAWVKGAGLSTHMPACVLPLGCVTPYVSAYRGLACVGCDGRARVPRTPAWVCARARRLVLVKLQVWVLVLPDLVDVHALRAGGSVAVVRRFCRIESHPPVGCY